MGKIITAPGYCTTKKKYLGFQFADRGTVKSLGGTYGIIGNSAVFSAESLNGDLEIDAHYAGCKHCGNKFAFRCGSCKMFFCYNGRPIKNFKCPECGTQFDVPRQSGNKVTICSRPLRTPKIYVTSSQFDNIGEVLAKMNIKFECYANNFDCDILALNCGSYDNECMSPQKLKSYVENGGCVYASDWADVLTIKAMPGIFNCSREGMVCSNDADVVDEDLKQYVGNTVKVEFDLPNWAVIKSCPGAKVLLRGSAGSRYAGVPIMISFKYGKGSVYFTSFHNHSQASDQETALLKLLLLKQMGTTMGTSIEQAGNALGVDMQGIKRTFRT